MSPTSFSAILLRSFMKQIKIIIILLVLFSLTSCSNLRTRDMYKDSLLTNIQNGNFQGSLQIIQDNKDTCFPEKDRVLYHLYMGMILHYGQDYNKSNFHLTKAEDAISELFTKSVSRAASSMLLNDNTLAYSGEDYEDLYINIFKALNYLNLDQEESAFVEIRRLNTKLNLLEDKYKEYAQELNESDDNKIQVKVKSIQFNNSALARFLGMLLYRVDNKFDDVRIDNRYLEEAFKLQAHIYNFSKPNLSEFSEVKRGSAKLSFISFTGLAPEKYPVTYRVATLENMITVFVDNGSESNGENFLFPGIEPGYYFKFAVAEMRAKQSQIHKIGIEINGTEVGQLEKLESVSRIAEETFAVKEGMAYVRAITRTVIKGIASIAAQKEIEKRTNEFGGFLAKIGTAALTEASEAADLRSCLVFPAYAYVGDFDIAPGTYDIKVNYYNQSGFLIASDLKANYEINENELNLIESYLLK